MKKLLFSLCLFSLLLLLSGCESASRLNLSQGYGNGLKLVHLSAGSGENYQRIADFQAALENSTPLEKDPALFAYYPDFLLEIQTPGVQEPLQAVVDINGDFVDFYYVGQEDTLYRAQASAEEFLALVHGD